MRFPTPDERALVANPVVETDPGSATDLGARVPARVTPAWARAQRRVWMVRSFWLALLAAGSGAWGQALLFDEKSKPGPGAGLLFLSMLLGAVAWSGASDAPLLCAAGASRWRNITWRRVLVLRLAGIAGSVVLAAGSVVANIAWPEALFGWQGWLWLAGMGLLLVSCARWYPRTNTDAALGPAWTRLEAGLFLALLAGSLLTHLALLDVIPWHFHIDEGTAFLETMRFYQGPMIPLFTVTWQQTSLPSLWFAFAAGVMGLAGGPSILGTRLAEAFIGALIVVPVYGIARLLWGRAAAGFAAFFVAVSAVGVHYSRISFINMTTAFWWAVCFYFLFRGMRSRRPGDFVWAGLAAGTGQYTFYGTRILLYLLPAYFVYLLVFHWRAVRDRLGHFALVVVGTFTGFGPLIGYFLVNPTMWTDRGLKELNVPPEIPATWATLVRDWNILAPLAWENVRSLSVAPSEDRFYYMPLLLVPEAVLFLLGLGVLIWRWRQPASFLLLFTGASVVFTGGILIEASRIPAFMHLTPIFPIIDLALALPLALWWRAWRRFPARLVPLGAVLLAGALAADALANADAYLVQYPAQVPSWRAFDSVRGRFIEALAPGTLMRFVETGWPPIDYAISAQAGERPVWPPFNPDVSRMMNIRVDSGDLVNPSRELPFVGDPSRDLAFVFYNLPSPTRPLMQELYPGGQVGALQNPDDPHMADTYIVPAAEAAKAYGVWAQVADPAAPDRPLWQGQVAQVGALPSTPAIHYPLVATWSGATYVVSGTLPVHMAAASNAPATLAVEGQPATADTALAVEPGWVRFVVQARLAGPTAVRLLVSQGAVPLAEVDTNHLWPAAPDQGLAVTLGTTNGSAAHRIDPFVAARALRNGSSFDPDLLPLGALNGSGERIRWATDLEIAAAGIYTMLLHTDSLARLSIDGKPVAWECQPGPRLKGTPAPVYLATGRHPVEIDLQTAPQAGGIWNGLAWIWTRPDGVQEVVPPRVLHLPAGATAAGPIPWPADPSPVVCPAH